MAINATNLYNTAYDTAALCTGAVANSIESARDFTLNFLNTNLPESATSTVSLVAKTINDSGASKFLANYGTTPAQAGAAILGGIGGNLLLSNPVSALVSITAGTLLTSNREELAMTAGTTFASGVLSFVARRILT